MIVALNMTDVERAAVWPSTWPGCPAELGCPVVETVAVQHNGHSQLLVQLDQDLARQQGALAPQRYHPGQRRDPEGGATHPGLAARSRGKCNVFTFKVDAWAMHPVWGLVILAVLLFLVFQAVFSWATVPMDAIKAAMAGSADWTAPHGRGPAAQPAGRRRDRWRGGVLVFLPQILILFFFILVLEDSGYLPRAAFLLDTLMGKVGLSGRAFIPLLSSFACAVPGIMATRTIANWRDRLATIMIAPLMTCSARLPVYALLIGAFIPDRTVGPLQPARADAVRPVRGGVLSAMGVAWIVQAHLDEEPLPAADAGACHHTACRVCATWYWPVGACPHLLRRVGTIIFALMVVLWFLPPTRLAWRAPRGRHPVQPGRDAGVRARTGFAPIGFNWQIAIALVPGNGCARGGG